MGITEILNKYKDIKPKDFGDFGERCYPVSCVIDCMEEYASQYADEQSVAFAEWLVKNATPRFPNKGEWTHKREIETKTTEQLLQIFKNENNGKA